MQPHALVKLQRRRGERDHGPGQYGVHSRDARVVRHERRAVVEARGLDAVLGIDGHPVQAGSDAHKVEHGGGEGSEEPGVDIRAVRGRIGGSVGWASAILRGLDNTVGEISAVKMPGLWDVGDEYVR